MTAPPPPFDYDAAVLACAAGERFALRMLYEREGRWLLGVAQRIVQDRGRAEDVLHDAFLQVWHSAATFRPEAGSARGWIYAIVRHQALREARRAGRQQPVDPADLTALSDVRQAMLPADDDRQLDASRLERCLDRLEASPRACVVHAYVDGYTHEQIADRLKTPIGTVKSWIRRSLARLKDCMA